MRVPQFDNEKVNFNEYMHTYKEQIICAGFKYTYVMRPIIKSACYQGQYTR